MFLRKCRLKKPQINVILKHCYLVKCCALWKLFVFPLGIPGPGSASSSAASWPGAQLLWHPILRLGECQELLCGDPNILELSRSPPALEGQQRCPELPSRSSPAAPRCSNLPPSSGGGRSESSGKALGKGTGIPSAAGLSCWRSCPRECWLLESTGK